MGSTLEYTGAESLVSVIRYERAETRTSSRESGATERWMSISRHGKGRGFDNHQRCGLMSL